MVQVIGAIYQNRSFFVRMDGNESEWKTQNSGIIQGCPLSRFLISVAMTCLLNAVEKSSKHQFNQIKIHISISGTLLYTNDTLILEANPRVAQAHLHAIREMGLRYSLELNNNKLELLACNDNYEIDLGDGARFRRKLVSFI